MTAIALSVETQQLIRAARCPECGSPVDRVRVTAQGQPGEGRALDLVVVEAVLVCAQAHHWTLELTDA